MRAGWERADNLGMPLVKPAAFAGAVSGKISNVVYVVTSDGQTIVRELPRVNDPHTAAQAEVRDHFHKAVALFSGLSAEEYRAWEEYARSVSAPGKRARAYGVYMALTTTYLRLHPSEWPPSLPPDAPFQGDNLRVTVAPSSFLSDDCAGRNEEGVGGGDPVPPPPTPSPVTGEGASESPSPTLSPVTGEGASESPSPTPPSSGRHEPSAPDEGGATFTADRPNSPGVTTALYLQRLRSIGEARNARKARLQRFFTFEPGGLSVTVPARPGRYEAAMKLVETATGQTTPLVWLGRIELA